MPTIADITAYIDAMKRQVSNHLHSALLDYGGAASPDKDQRQAMLARMLHEAVQKAGDPTNPLWGAIPFAGTVSKLPMKLPPVYPVEEMGVDQARRLLTQETGMVGGGVPMDFWAAAREKLKNYRPE